MSTQGAILSPISVTLGGSWAKVGAGSNVAAVQSDDGDTSYLWNADDAVDVLTIELTVPVLNTHYEDGADFYQIEYHVVGRNGGVSTTDVTLDGYLLDPPASRTLQPTTHGEVSFTSSFDGDPLTPWTQEDIEFDSPWIEVVGQAGASEQPRITYAYAYINSYSAPDAPTGVAVSSSGTLTPNIVGYTSDPDGDEHFSLDFEVRRVSNNALMWSFNEPLSPFEGGRANGSQFSKAYGGSALTDGVAYKVRVRSTDSDSMVGDWSAFVEWTPTVNDAPTASQISPSAGATLGTLTPTLSVGFTDPDAEDQVYHYEIEVRRVSDSVSFLDTGQVATSAGEKTAARVDLVYNGTTLVNGTSYEWRARVWDSQGAVSAFTSWRAFTIAAVPQAPTVVSPSGSIDDDTPSITGVYNQGSGGTETHFQYRIYQSGVAIYTSGDETPDIATGVTYGGSPALSFGTEYQIDMRSKDNGGNYSDWSAKTTFTLNGVPSTPTNLSPDDAVLGDTTPGLAWTHNPGIGDDAQTEAKVYLKVQGGAYVTGYDPKTLSQAGGTHTVTETLTAGPTVYEWWVTTKANNAGHSGESDHALFTVATVPVIVVDEPDPSDVIAAPSLLVEWTFSGGSGTQQDYRVRIYAADQTTLLIDSGVVPSTDEEYQVAGTGTLRNDTTYYLRVTVNDDLAQEADSGFIAFSTSWTAPAAPTGLSASAIGDQA